MTAGTRLLAAASALLATACGCDADLQVRLDTAERTLAVGESFTPTVKFYVCGGRDQVQDVVTWTAGDTTIVRVDARTGRATALRVGETVVVPTGKTYGAVVEVAVRVVERSR